MQILPLFPITVISPLKPIVVTGITISDPTTIDQNIPISANVNGGSAPYSYIWALNGRIISQTSNPSIELTKSSRCYIWEKTYLLSQ